MEHFFEHLRGLRRKRREVIICADWNICHKEIDLKNWKPNQKNSGFLPHERAWLDRVMDELGWVDAFRRVNPDPHQYTWWSNRGQAWAKNVGWRLDYLLVTPGIAEHTCGASIYRSERFFRSCTLDNGFYCPLERINAGGAQRTHRATHERLVKGLEVLAFTAILIAMGGAGYVK